MKNRKVAWLITILMVVAAIAFGQFKAPVQQSDNFYVTDAANLFTDGEENALVAVGQQLAHATDARLVVVTVKHTGLRSLEDYANLLCEEWHLTGADLLLVMTVDNYYLSVDFGWWPEIEEQLDYLLNHCLEPKFGVRNYSAAVQDLAVGVEAVLLGGGAGYEDWGGDYVSGDGGSVLLGFLIVVVIVVVVLAFSNKRPAAKRKYYGGYATPSMGGFVGTVGRAATRSAINTMGSTIRSSTSRPASRPASRSSFSSGSRGGGGRSSGGSRGGGGRSGGSRGGGGRR